TLVDAVVSLLRKKQSSVAVLATDPNSPFSGGAILGDRIRMQRHALDPKVFIRSMGARGHLGGLSLASREAIRLLGAFGFDEVILETVGVGQSELEVHGVAGTSRSPREKRPSAGPVRAEAPRRDRRGGGRAGPAASAASTGRRS